MLHPTYIETDDGGSRVLPIASSSESVLKQRSINVLFISMFYSSFFNQMFHLSLAYTTGARCGCTSFFTEKFIHPLGKQPHFLSCEYFRGCRYSLRQPIELNQSRIVCILSFQGPPFKNIDLTDLTFQDLYKFDIRRLDAKLLLFSFEVRTGPRIVPFLAYTSARWLPFHYAPWP